MTGVWYGKTPGLDRASDALRHANLIGTDPHGGALALAGDDPAAKSSTMPGSSELALADLGMPTFAPADPAEILEYGLHAVELSRASGLWAALKVATVVADGAATAAVSGWRPPDLADLPAGLTAYVHKPTAYLLGATLAELERSFHQVRLPLALEYARRSGVNRITGPAGARIGIVSGGATYLALRQALTTIGLDEAGLDRAGIRLLQARHALPARAVQSSASSPVAWTRSSCVEDKRAFVEDAVKSMLYGRPRRAAGHGQATAATAARCCPPYGELDADIVATGPLALPGRSGVTSGSSSRTPPRQRQPSLPLAARTPYFCSGCPHNSSTEVAPGTLVGGGIGCHAMVVLMPGERRRRRHRADPDGRRGRAVDRHGAVRRRSAHLVQNIGRRHVRALRQPRRAGSGRRWRERDLQAAAQLGRRDDRRPATGRRAEPG